MEEKGFMKKYRRLFAASLLFIMGISLLGCRKEEGLKEEERPYTFTVLTDLHFPHGDYNSYDESPFHSGLGEATGVNINWIYPKNHALNDYELNVLIANNNLPDIIFTNLNNPEYFIEEGYIIPLNDYIEEYAPNLYKILKSDSTLDRASKTDKGYYYLFPFIREMKSSTFQGLVVREDWLLEQNLEPPTTIAEFDHVLRVFHEKYNAVFSFTPAWTKQALIGSFGTINGYYIDRQGHIQHGLATPAYKEFLKQMNIWYKDGILDPNFAVMDAGSLGTLALQNKIGATVTTSNILTSWIESAKEIGNEYNWLPLKTLVLNEGDPIEFSQMEGQMNGYGAYITSSCKDIEAAIRFLDWSYSEEGILFWNFGVEGVSYEMVDGEPVFITPDTDETLSSFINRYTGIRWGGPSLSLLSMFEQINNPIAVNASQIWSEDSRMLSHLVPNMSSTWEETNELYNLEDPILSYMDDMYYRFIMGETSLDQFDDYLKTLDFMNLKRVLQIKQEQLRRYNNR
mgnify:CR=1 FL=1